MSSFKGVVVVGRRCTSCKEDKPASEFYVRKTGKQAGLLVDRCKQCTREYTKKYRHENRERVAEYMRTYRKKKADSLRAQEKDYRRKNASRTSATQKSYKLKITYGITLEDYNRLFAAQFGLCAICGSDGSEFSKALHVDHDHQTGRVRGLLCHGCNVGLGVFRDDTWILERAISYLEGELGGHNV